MNFGHYSMLCTQASIPLLSKNLPLASEVYGFCMSGLVSYAVVGSQRTLLSQGANAFNLTGHIQFLNIQTQNGMVLHNNARKGESKCGEITPLL